MMEVAYENEDGEGVQGGKMKADDEDESTRRRMKVKKEDEGCILR